MNLLTWIREQMAINRRRKIHTSVDIIPKESPDGVQLYLNRPVGGGGASGEDPTNHIYLGTIAGVTGGGVYSVTISKDEETLTISASLLGWNADYAELSVGQQVYVVFTKSPTLIAQIEV